MTLQANIISKSKKHRKKVFEFDNFFSFFVFSIPFSVFLALPHHAGLENDVFLLFLSKILVAAFLRNFLSKGSSVKTIFDN